MESFPFTRFLDLYIAATKDFWPDVADEIRSRGPNFDFEAHGQYDSLESIESVMFLEDELCLEKSFGPEYYVPDEAYEATTLGALYEIVCRSVNLEPRYAQIVHL